MLNSFPVKIPFVQTIYSLYSVPVKIRGTRRTFTDSNRVNNIDTYELDGVPKDPDAEVLKLDPLLEKWKTFNWHTQNIDGHSFAELDKAIYRAQRKNRPSVIICNTVKGKGVKFMENKLDYNSIIFHNLNNSNLCY